MRLMNTAATVPYVHPTEREPAFIPNPDTGTKEEHATIPNPDAGNPKPGATVWHLRAITSREDGALQDAVYDMTRTTAVQDKDGDTKVKLNMAVSPSSLRRNRVRLGIGGWDNLLDAEGNAIPFTREEFTLGARTFQGVPEEVLDMMPQSLITILASEVERHSSVTPTEGNV